MLDKHPCPRVTRDVWADRLGAVFAALVIWAALLAVIVV